MGYDRAPEPTEQDIARAAAATAKEVFDGSDGKLTVAYYRRLRAVGPMGVVCLNLFRSQKTSFRAKMYRGRQYRNASYETKNYSLNELVKALENVPQITWGWQHDPNTPGFEWCLYCELPTGQCSFHSAIRLSGPDFTGKWDGIKGGSVVSILMFCDMVLGREVPDHRPCWTRATLEA
jgi:hypothetical protein